MKKLNEFVIKKGAFITCFSSFVFNLGETPNYKVKDIIAYSALLKNDISVDYDRIRYLFPKIGIEKLTIIYVTREGFDEEFRCSIDAFKRKNEDLSHTLEDTNFHFQTANLEVFLELALKGLINVFKGGAFDTKHCLFIFHGFT